MFSQAAATELAENPVPGEMSSSRDSCPCWSDSATLAQQTVDVISGDDSHQKTEAAFRREMVKLIEAKTNGLVADASTR